MQKNEQTNTNLSSFQKNVAEIKFHVLDFQTRALPCAPTVAGKTPHSQVCRALWEVSQGMQNTAIQMGAVCGPPEM